MIPEQELLVLCESRRTRCSRTRLQLHNKTIANTCNMRHGKTLCINALRNNLDYVPYVGKEFMAMGTLSSSLISLASD